MSVFRSALCLGLWSSLSILMLFAVSSCKDAPALEDEAECPIGSEGCHCTTGKSCDPGLTCLSSRCVNQGGDSESGSDGDTDTDTDGDTDMDTDGDTDTDADGDTDADADGDTDADADGDADSDADADADGDSDGDADGDSDGDADGDTDADADTDTDTDADGDTDSDADGDTDTDADTDTDTDVPALVDIMPDTTGWTDRTGNVLGIQGPWYTFGGLGSSLTPAEGGQFDNTGEMCFSGYTLSADCDVDYLTCDWDTFWGAAMAFNVCQTTDTETPPEEAFALGACPYNAKLGEQVIGFEFDIYGSVDGGELRVVFDEGLEGDNAYIEITTLSSSAVKTYPALFDRARIFWDDTATKRTIPADVFAVHFSIPSDGFDTKYFDFCITDIRAMTATK